MPSGVYKRKPRNPEDTIYDVYKKAFKQECWYCGKRSNITFLGKCEFCGTPSDESKHILRF